MKAKAKKLVRRNVLAVVVLSLACLGVFLFSWFGTRKGTNDWKVSLTLATSTPTAALAPADG